MSQYHGRLLSLSPFFDLVGHASNALTRAARKASRSGSVWGSALLPAEGFEAPTAFVFLDLTSRQWEKRWDDHLWHLTWIELCPAALGFQLLRSTVNALQSLPITITEIIGWTDSTIVLSWLASYPGTWSCFVGKRVALIQEQIPPSQWKHVSSDQNPTDCVSRGMTASEMISFDLRWQGPSWLSHCDSSWPHQPSIPSIAPPKKRKGPLTGLHLVEKRAVIDFDRFSNFNRLQRTLVFVLRFLDSFSGLSPIQGPIQQSELVKARSKLVTLQCELCGLEKAPTKNISKIKAQSHQNSPGETWFGFGHLSMFWQLSKRDEVYSFQDLYNGIRQI